MTALQQVKKLIKDGFTAEGVLGAKRMKVWKAKDFADIHHGHKPTGTVIGVALSVLAPKSKSTLKERRWVEIRWKGAPPSADTPERDLLEMEFSVCIGWKRFTGVRGEQLAALIDAVLYPATAEVIALKK